jgi:Helix-turn-helix of DDE superfamily endonuclease
MGPCGPIPSVLHRHRPATPGELIAELADPGPPSTRPRWPTAAATHAAGAGPHQRLVLCDRVVATLIVLRLQLPHQALAVLLGVDRATITRAIGQIRPLLAARGFAVPGQPTLRLPTLADVVAPAAANGVELRIDGTETQVRRPRAHRPGRRAFISGKRKQKHPQAHRGQRRPGPHPVGRGGAPGPPARPDRGQHRGIADLLTQHPGVKVRVDEGYQGLASAFAGQVTAPPRKPAKDAAAELVAACRQARTEQSSRRICVEHAIAEPKHWRSLQRWLGRRESFGETYLAVAGLVSDRAARR